jgi:hypothetical protein
MPVRAQLEAGRQLDVATREGVIPRRQREAEHRTALVELDRLGPCDATDALRGLAVERLGVRLRSQRQLDVRVRYLPVVRCMAAR